jgi:hypothetical protein
MNARLCAAVALAYRYIADGKAAGWGIAPEDSAKVVRAAVVHFPLSAGLGDLYRVHLEIEGRSGSFFVTINRTSGAVRAGTGEAVPREIRLP